MSKFSKMLAASGILVVALGLTGCQNAAPQKAPEVALQEGISKLSGITSYGFNLGVKGDLNGPEGKTPAKVNLDLAFTGGIDMKDAKDPKFNLDAKGSMMADADGGNGEVGFRLNKEAIFANLMSLEGKGAVVIPDEMKAQLVGKWWTMPIPPAALDEMAKSLPSGGDANLTDDQKQMKALVEQTQFFKNVKFVGMESVGGEQSAHYSAELDKDAFMTFIGKVSDIQKQPMDDAAKAEMKSSLDSIDFSGDMYVGQTSGALNEVKGNLVFKPKADNSSPSGTVMLSLMLSDLNKPVVVEAPKDAQPIPPEALGSLGL